MRLSDNLFELIPYAHLISPDETATRLEAILASSTVVSSSNVSMLFELSYAELELCGDYLAVLNPNNPFTIKINGAKLIPLIGISGAFKIVYVLRIIRLVDNL